MTDSIEGRKVSVDKRKMLVIFYWLYTLLFKIGTSKVTSNFSYRNISIVVFTVYFYVKLLSLVFGH